MQIPWSLLQVSGRPLQDGTSLMRPGLNLYTLLTDQCCPFVRQEAAALSEAQASNQALRVQLVEATSAFHHALSIAQTLLTEGSPCKHCVLLFSMVFWYLHTCLASGWITSNVPGHNPPNCLVKCFRSACCMCSPFLLVLGPVT